MYADLTPTTTLTELTRNNTSAADSFPGWPNGVAKPGNVSTVPLAIPQKKFVHRCDWWGGSSHPNIGIQSSDPAYCAKTVGDMKARGLNGCLLDWYGPGSHEDVALRALEQELVKQGLEFGICVDAGCAALKAATTVATKTDALLKILNYAGNTYAASPAYLKHNGRPVILLFGFSTGDYDWARVRSAITNPLFIFRWEIGYSARSYADGYFGWTHCNEAWITDLKTKAPGKLIMLGVNGGFNSSIKTPPVNCSWGSGIIIPQRGGLQIQDALALCKAHPEIELTSFNTWNDYQEGSPLEPGIATGISLGIGVQNGKLITSVLQSPAQVGGFSVVDHYDAFISADGEKLHPFCRMTGLPTPVDLVAMNFPPGDYVLYVQAVMGPMLQNVMSNPLPVRVTVSVTGR